jgi:hypothetical protein
MHERKPSATVGVERTSRRKRKKLDRLTRDAIAAQEAGMSYGQWKALHPHTPDEDDENEQELDPDKEVAVCEHCGQRFIKSKRQTTRRFCGADCQKNYNSKKRREKARQEAIGRTAVCPICGADFLANYQHRIYCSPECFAEGQRQRNKDRVHRKQSTPSKKKLETDLDMVAATCEQCGRQFMKHEYQTRKRFCSTTCQTRNRSIRMAEKRNQEPATRTATCAICGATFTPANGNSKYCSECQVEVHKQQNRAWYARKQEKQKKEAAENGGV